MNIETIKDKTPNFISKNFNKDIEFTGLEKPTKKEIEGMDAVHGDYDFGRLPDFDDVKKLTPFIPVWKQAWGQCDFYARNYLQKQAMILSGIPVDVEFVIDVDWSYVNRKYKNHLDSGTVVRWAHESFVKVGLPVCLRPQSHAKDKFGKTYTQFKKNVQNESVGKVKSFPFYKKVKSGVDALSLFKAIHTQKNPFVFRFSIINDNGVSVYHRTVPKIIGKRNLRGGAHSLAGVTATGLFEFRGEPAFQSFESTGSVETHIWKLSVAMRSIYAWEIYEVTTPTVSKKPAVLPPAKDHLLSTIRPNSSVLKIKALQKYLGVKQDGIWKTKTRGALQKWQLKYMGKKFTGNSWTGGNIAVYKAIKKIK